MDSLDAIRTLTDMQHAADAGTLAPAPEISSEVASVFDGMHLLPVHRLKQQAPRLGRPVPMDQILAAQARTLNCRFKVNGSSITPDMIFSPEAFLPIVVLYADERSRTLLGGVDGFPTTYQIEPDALLGFRVNFPPMDGSISSLMRGLMLQHAAVRLFGMQPDTEVELADVVLRYRSKLHEELGVEDKQMFPGSDTDQQRVGEDDDSGGEAMAAPIQDVGGAA